MLKKILSLLVAIYLLLTPLASYAQPNCNGKHTAVSESTISTITSSTCNHSAKATHDCCDKPCVNCSCSCTHLSVSIIYALLSSPAFIHPPVANTYYKLGAISRTTLPELPPPLS